MLRLFSYAHGASTQHVVTIIGDATDEAQRLALLVLRTAAVVILFFALIRFHLRECPLERDEGEYAYAGQLMLQGIPPYQLAYSMKLPGTFAAYAVILAIFGQTPERNPSWFALRQRRDHVPGFSSAQASVRPI